MNWLVTGASQGVGRCLVEDALGRGDTVTAAVRDAASIRDLVDAHPGRLDVIEADLRDRAAVARVAAVIGESPIDVLVNNAGRADPGGAAGLDGVRRWADVARSADYPDAPASSRAISTA